MKLTFLGTGTSIGVPAIGCDCAVCRSKEPKDKRLRASAILETEGGLRILIDCGPDFRQQIIRYKSPYNLDLHHHLKEEGNYPFFGKFDAVLYTHIHYDHVGGTDDLRPFSMFGDVNCYAQQDVIDGLHHVLPYCFKQELYPGVPHLKLHEIKAGVPFTISRSEESRAHLFRGGSTLEGEMEDRSCDVVIPASEDELEIMPVQVFHGKLPILGFRIGKMAYITDMKSIDADNMKLLHGVETLVVNALRFEKEHHSHQLVHSAIDFAREVGARKTYFIHVTHDIGTHEEANRRLPAGFEFAYDGQVIDC